MVMLDIFRGEKVCCKHQVWEMDLPAQAAGHGRMDVYPNCLNIHSETAAHKSQLLFYSVTTLTFSK